MILPIPPNPHYSYLAIRPPLPYDDFQVVRVASLEGVLTKINTKISMEDLATRVCQID